MNIFAAHITFDPDTPSPWRGSLITCARLQKLSLDELKDCHEARA